MNLLISLFLGAGLPCAVEGGGAPAGPRACPLASAESSYQAFPVTDRTRSVMRTVREHLGLTAQHMRALNLSYPAAMQVLSLIHTWVEPRLGELEGLRAEYTAARNAHLSDEAARWSLRERLCALESSAAAESAVGRRLAAQLAEREQGAEQRRARYEQATARLEQALAPLRQRLGAVLTPEQNRRWAACLHNQVQGLPMSVWFVPGLSPDQQRRLQRGEALAVVLSAEQAAIAQDSGRHYQSAAEVIRRAEKKFFFGREVAASPTTGPAADIPPQCPLHAAGRQSQ